MVVPFTFSRLPEIHFGNGKFKNASAILKHCGKNILVVTGKSSFLNSNSGKAFLEALKNDKYNFSIESVSGEPEVATIDKIVEKYRKSDVNVIVGIGGGSVIDAGKAISAMIKENGSVEDFLEGSKSGKQHNGLKIPFIAVPTTAGTGSETTKNAVISKTGENGFKRSLRHENFIPDIAIVDPELTIDCPSEVTAASGLDALTQLLEAYISTSSTVLTDALAFDGLQHCINNLEIAYKDGHNVQARSSMSYAAMLSGITLANAGLGVIHGFASSIGGLYNIPHGVICGTLLAESTKMNVKKLIHQNENSASLKKIVKLGRLISTEKEKSDYYHSMMFSNFVFSLTEKLKIPKLSNYEVKIESIDKIVEMTGLKNNPVQLNKSELAHILQNRI